VLEALQHVQLVVDHALVALDVLLQDDLDGDLAGRAVCLADDAIRAGAQGSAEAILGPITTSVREGQACGRCEGCALLVVALGLAIEAVEHSGDWGWEKRIVSSLRGLETEDEHVTAMGNGRRREGSGD
jgi:hypothetical protein